MKFLGSLVNTNFSNIDNINVSRANNRALSNNGVTAPYSDKLKKTELDSKQASQAVRACILGGISYATTARLNKLQETFQDVFMNK